MSKLSGFAKNFVKDIGLSALDILKQNISGSTTGVLPKQTAIQAENLAAGLVGVGSSYKTSTAITYENINVTSNRTPYGMSSANRTPAAVIAAKGYSLGDQSTTPQVVIDKASADQKLRVIDLVTYSSDTI